MNKISISRFSFSLNIPFLLELCFLAEVTWVEICVSHGLNSGWAVLWHRSTSSSGSQKVWEAVISFTYQAPFFYFVSNQTKCAEMCLPSTNPFLSLSLSPAESPVPPTQLRSICLQDTNPYFFHPRYHTHTHTLALIQLYRQTHADPGAPHLCFTRSFIIAQWKCWSVSLSECLPSAFLFPEQRLSALGEDASLELLVDQYYTGLKLDLQSDKSTSAAVSPTHNPLKMYSFFPH